MRALLALTAAVALAGCASSRFTFTGEPKYGKTAEANYAAGMDEMRSESWTDAAKFFEHVRSRFPFSTYAPLAELRLADLQVAQDHLSEAAAAYATFVRMHPAHPDADYAAFREGEALVQDAPSDFILFPPDYERDLKSVSDGAARLEAFLERYPASKYRPQAEKMLAKARDLLAERDWYVAGFYAKRGHWAGAAGRYQALITTYPRSPLAVDAYFRLADACVRLKDRYRARRALQELIVKYPDDPRRARAERRLAALR